MGCSLCGSTDLIDVHGSADREGAEVGVEERGRTGGGVSILLCSHVLCGVCAEGAHRMQTSPRPPELFLRPSSNHMSRAIALVVPSADPVSSGGGDGAGGGREGPPPPVLVLGREASGKGDVSIVDASHPSALCPIFGTPS